MSNIVPSGWKTYDLGELALKIEGGGTPSRIEPAFWKGDLPWATVKDLKKVRLTSTLEFISVLGLEQSASKLIPANTMILASRMAVGKAVIFDCDVTINQDLKAFYPKKNLETEFLLQWYLSKSELIESLGTGSTVKGIKLDDIKTLPITLPPYPEQQKIAAILTSVDDVIEKTQAQINKLKDLKIGMMQELLTRGVGVDGKPHTEFKDSPVGRIPKGWDVVLMDAICHKITDGEHQTPKRSDNGYYLLSARNIRDGYIDLNNVDYIQDDEYQRISKRVKPKKGDILISCSGSVGRVAVVPADLEFSMVRSVAILQLKMDMIDSEFLASQVSSTSIQYQIEQSLSQQAQANLFQGAIKKLLVILPSISEQEKIAKIVNSVVNRINIQQKKLEQLKVTKKALMQDLLTGKVRVNVD